MTDILWQLRDPIVNYDPLHTQAATEIERLRFELKAAQNEIAIADDKIEQLRAENAKLRRDPAPNNLLLQELNKLVGEQKDALAARKAEIDRLNEKLERLRRDSAIGSNLRERAFQLAVLGALSRLLWECGDKVGHESLQRLMVELGDE